MTAVKRLQLLNNIRFLDLDTVRRACFILRVETFIAVKILVLALDIYVDIVVVAGLLH